MVLDTRVFPKRAVPHGRGTPDESERKPEPVQQEIKKAEEATLTPPKKEGEGKKNLLLLLATGAMAASFLLSTSVSAAALEKKPRYPKAPLIAYHDPMLLYLYPDCASKWRGPDLMIGRGVDNITQKPFKLEATFHEGPRSPFSISLSFKEDVWEMRGNIFYHARPTVHINQIDVKGRAHRKPMVPQTAKYPALPFAQIALEVHKERMKACHNVTIPYSLSWGPRVR